MGDDVCAICLETLEPKAPLTRLGCAHSFHPWCILQAYASVEAVDAACPVCRGSYRLLPNDATRPKRRVARPLIHAAYTCLAVVVVLWTARTPCAWIGYWSLSSSCVLDAPLYIVGMWASYAIVHATLMLYARVHLDCALILSAHAGILLLASHAVRVVRR